MELDHLLTHSGLTYPSHSGINCFTRNGGNAIPKHAGPEAKGSNPATGFTLLWACNPFRRNFNHWQVSWKEAGQIFFKRHHGCGEGIQNVPGGKVSILGGHSIGRSKQKWMCVLFRTVSQIELFECTTAKLLIRKRYYVYVLFLIPVFIVQVTQLVQFIINVRKFHRQHQCTLQLVWRHGVLFVWVRLDDRVTGQNYLDFLQNELRKQL